jgi:hypothetical protein
MDFSVIREAPIIPVFRAVFLDRSIGIWLHLLINSALMEVLAVCESKSPSKRYKSEINRLLLECQGLSEMDLDSISEEQFFDS